MLTSTSRHARFHWSNDEFRSIGVLLRRQIGYRSLKRHSKAARHQECRPKKFDLKERQSLRINWNEHLFDWLQDGKTNHQSYPVRLRAAARRKKRSHLQHSTYYSASKRPVRVLYARTSKYLARNADFPVSEKHLALRGEPSIINQRAICLTKHL